MSANLSVVPDVETEAPAKADALAKTKVTHTANTAELAVTIAEVSEAAATAQDLEREVTRLYLERADLSGTTPAAIATRLVHAVNVGVMQANLTVKDKTDKLPKLRALSPATVADLMIALDHVVLVAMKSDEGDRERMLLATYDADPASPTFGTYRTHEPELRVLARRYSRNLSQAAWIGEVRSSLVDRAPIVRRTLDRDLVPMANGVLDYRTKELRPYSPDVVFLSKSPVAWNPDAENPVITMPDGETWNVETWMAGLSDDPEIVELLWQVTGAAIRPGVRWNKSAWYYSKHGNNGKGTLMALQRNVVGSHRVAELSLKDMTNGHFLEDLATSAAVMGDENDVGMFVEEASTFKRVVTGDPVLVNPKHRRPYSVEPAAMVVQCLNEMPRFKDTTDSFYRRQLFIPFTKWFGGAGVERKYIKADYLQRQDVLEYVAKRVLAAMPDYYELAEPAVCAEVLEQYKVTTDPVRDFWETVHGSIVGDVWTQPLLHDLWSAWARKRAMRSEGMSAAKLLAAIDRIASETGEWQVRAGTQTRVKGEWLREPEPLVKEYGLDEWVRHDRNGMPIWDSAPREGRACGTRVQGVLERTEPSDLTPGEAARQLVRAKMRLTAARAAHTAAVAMAGTADQDWRQAHADAAGHQSKIEPDGCAVDCELCAEAHSHAEEKSIHHEELRALVVAIEAAEAEVAALSQVIVTKS